MVPESFHKINKLNQKFYDIIAAEFDSSRQYYWDGWEVLLSKLSKFNKSINVLDIGCGNCRFYEFLISKGCDVGNYTGVDFSQGLIDKATQKYKQINTINADVFGDNWIKDLKTKDFDLVVMFGVMHHVASEGNRVDLLNKISDLLDKNGTAVITTWEFLSASRISNKILDLTTLEGQKILVENELRATDFENGDYILDWKRGQKAYRYGHIYTPEDIQKLAKTSELKIVDSFYSDGKEGNINKYYIFKSLYLT